MILKQYDKIISEVSSRFSHLIIKHYFVKSPNGRIQKLRFELLIFSFIDIYFSSSSGKYAFHYESQTDFYRHDNSPRHESIKTFPKHCHYNNKVFGSYLPDDIISASYRVLQFNMERIIS